MIQEDEIYYTTPNGMKMSQTDAMQRYGSEEFDALVNNGDLIEFVEEDPETSDDSDNDNDDQNDNSDDDQDEEISFEEEMPIEIDGISQNGDISDFDNFDELPEEFMVDSNG